MIIFLTVLQDRNLAIRALKGNYAVGELSLLIVFLILQLNQVSADASSPMLAFLDYRNNF